jgi:signal transduction histidine kinase
MTMRPTLRWRLTAIYGLLFFAAGGLLLTVNYALVRRSLPADQVLYVPDPAAIIGRRQAIIGGSRVGPFPSEGGLRVLINGQAVPPEAIEDLPSRVRAAALDELLRQSLVGLLAVGVGSLGVSWWLSGRALHPLHRITDTARRLTDTTLHQRIDLDGPDDELKELADTFDAMLGRLDAAFASQRRFVANASHELRTPLAIMRTQLEVASTPEELAAAVEVVRQTIDRSERLVDGLLVLARADGQLNVEPIDLADVLRTGVTAVEPQRVELDARPAPVEGDPALLFHLARNLFDNAQRYNVPDGWVRARSGVEGDRAVLEVSNSGPVVPPDAVEGLFEPFRRLAADRTGGEVSAGLGLSIVRAVAEAHGGTVVAQGRPDGGLRVEVRLPARVEAMLSPVTAPARGRTLLPPAGEGPS